MGSSPTAGATHFKVLSVPSARPRIHRVSTRKNSRVARASIAGSPVVTAWERTTARNNLFLILLYGNNINFEDHIFGGGDFFLFSVLVGDGIFLADGNVVDDELIP